MAHHLVGWRGDELSRPVFINYSELVTYDAMQLYVSLRIIQCGVRC
jgi:hypothetical protein